MSVYDDEARPETLPEGIARLPRRLEVLHYADLAPGSVWVADADFVTVTEEGYVYVQPTIPVESFDPENDTYIVVVRTFDGYVLDSATTLPKELNLQKRESYYKQPNSIVQTALGITRLVPAQLWISTPEELDTFKGLYETQFNRPYVVGFNPAELQPKQGDLDGEKTTDDLEMPALRVLAMELGRTGIEQANTWLRSKITKAIAHKNKAPHDV